MRPITFRCNATLLLTPEVIAGQILDLARWPEFAGYGPLPDIRSVEFEALSPDVVGTRIRVTNRDDSSPVEEVVEWQPARQVRAERGRDERDPLVRVARQVAGDAAGPVADLAPAAAGRRPPPAADEQSDMTTPPGTKP